MLKKKNYKEIDHFTQYYNVFIPRPNGTKLMLYFKRYKPKQITKDATVYDLIHSSQKLNDKQQGGIPYPIDRTLQIISFDEDLLFLKDLLRKIGKIRKFETGQTKYKGKNTFYGIVVFKYQFDLVKCFRDEYFQGLVNNHYKIVHVNEEEKEDYHNKIITQYLGEQLETKVDRLKELQKDGYNVITNKFGQYKLDYEANQKFVEDLPQVKRKKKSNQTLLKNVAKKQKIQD